MGTWQRPIVWTINIYRDRFIFYWVFLDGWRKFPKKKTSYILQQTTICCKKTEGTWQWQSNFFLTLIYRGTWQRGEYGKGYYGIVIFFVRNFINYPALDLTIWLKKRDLCKFGIKIVDSDMCKNLFHWLAIILQLSIIIIKVIS